MQPIMEHWEPMTGLVEKLCVKLLDKNFTYDPTPYVKGDKDNWVTVQAYETFQAILLRNAWFSYLEANDPALADDRLLELLKEVSSLTNKGCSDILNSIAQVPSDFQFIPHRRITNVVIDPSRDIAAIVIIIDGKVRKK